MTEKVQTLSLRYWIFVKKPSMEKTRINLDLYAIFWEIWSAAYTGENLKTQRK